MINNIVNLLNENNIKWIKIDEKLKMIYVFKNEIEKCNNLKLMGFNFANY